MKFDLIDQVDLDAWNKSNLTALSQTCSSNVHFATTKRMTYINVVYSESESQYPPAAMKENKA